MSPPHLIQERLCAALGEYQVSLPGRRLLLSRSSHSTDPSGRTHQLRPGVSAISQIRGKAGNSQSISSRSHQAPLSKRSEAGFGLCMRWTGGF
ncbi:hypothetical protein T02_15078 [Trichinella nativa]|uniref:Uncharacterized protein n=1 Tax=Trichinella nativa TaxID=6335 RepID=A0A0V1KRY3_9BILA|nr:hypothetical protein T02_15078 [Trichinella nativa]